MRDGPVLHLFGGKGGAGKSTLASAFALTLTDAAPKESVVLCSSEPTKALSDVWKRRLTGKPTKLVPGKGEGGLSAYEFEIESVQARAEAVRSALASGALKGLLLSDEDVGKLVSGVVPGLEPLLGLLDLMAQLEAGKVDRAVVDMAGRSVESGDPARLLAAIGDLVKHDAAGRCVPTNQHAHVALLWWRREG